MSVSEVTSDVQRLLGAAVEHAGCGVTLADYRQPDHPLIYVNEAFTRMTGYSAEELLHRNCRFLQGPDTAEDAVAEIRRALAAGESCTVILKNYRKNGEAFDNELRLAPIRDEQGAITHLVGIQTDVTARVREAGENERLLEELQTANHNLSEFAYIISHDLQAPLRAIGSLTQWLATDYTEVLDETGVELVTLVNKRVDWMREMIHGVLDYSRVGRMQEPCVPVDLNTMVRQVVESLDPPGHIRVSIQEGLPVLTCEPTRMTQVIRNLIDNAIRFMDKEDGRIEVGGTEVPDGWELTVSDNGPGIEEKYHDKVFQIFQSLDSQKDSEHVGVGLSIAKKFIELNGGRMWITSPPGQGSTFHLYWPHPSQDD